MRCQECGKETDTKHLRQCQEQDCDIVRCAKCMEAHDLDHRHNDKERAANKYLDASMAYMHSLMFSRLPVAAFLMLMVTGTHVALDVGMDGEGIIAFNLPEIGRIGAVGIIMILLPQAVTTGAMHLIWRFTKPIVPEWIVEAFRKRLVKLGKAKQDGQEG